MRCAFGGERLSFDAGDFRLPCAWNKYGIAVNSQALLLTGGEFVCPRTEGKFPVPAAVCTPVFYECNNSIATMHACANGKND